MPKDHYGGQKKKQRSLVQRAAHSAPRARGKIKVKTFTKDASRTTFGRLKDNPDKAKPPPIGKQIVKGQFEKMLGTRIQHNKGGVAVRVVLESGKEFAPENVSRVKQHMAKLDKARAEREEIARIRGDEVPVDEEKKKPAAPQKAEGKQPRAARAAPAAADKRSVSDARYSGTVVERPNKKVVWVKLDLGQELPAEAATKLAELHMRRGEGKEGYDMPDDALPVRLIQKAEKLLKLLMGMQVSFSLHLDHHGVSGCNIALGGVSAEPSAVVGKRGVQETSPESAKKRQKSDELLVQVDNTDAAAAEPTVVSAAPADSAAVVELALPTAEADAVASAPAAIAEVSQECVAPPDGSGAAPEPSGADGGASS
mmetsp:Transcript_78921/g.226150  ORF Transcript_78921/g.226150 Transcript_78921/m.226150 type:complete len:369 (-) Transcript_78921:63-1169(-)